MPREILRTVLRFLFRIFSDLQLIGIEYNLPDTGALLCSNHISILDGPLIFAHLTQRNSTALVATKHRKNPFLRWIVNIAGGIWLNREELDTQAIRTAVNFLNQGGLLGIAPEGTRSKKAGLLPAKSGVAYLAAKSHAKIVPIAITGTENAWSSLMKFHRPKIKIIFGAPFDLPPLDRSNRDKDLERNTDEIMCRIAALLPEKYRGVYAGNIRLQELIDQGYPQQNGAAC